MPVPVTCTLPLYCPADVPVLRHYSYTNKFYGAVKGWMLTIRMVAEVYNYDYIIDTHLYVDGTFETRVQTSG
jgi:primary-amine oxidase